MTDRQSLAKALLRAGARGLTTVELYEASGSLNPSRRLSEMRAEGFPVSDAIPDGRTAGGKPIFRYCIEAPKGAQGILNLEEATNE